MRGSACIPNIGPRERRRRRITGVVMLAVAAALTIGLASMDAPASWRFLVFVPAFMGTLGLFQVRSSTCVVLAAQGRRNMDDGPVAIEEAAERDAIASQAWRVAAQAGLAAAAITLAAFLV